VPSESNKQSASLTLAYAFDDHAVSIVANHLGMKKESIIFQNRSINAYKHLWNNERQLLCPKSGIAPYTIHCPFDAALPYPFETTYTEGDALQWLWFVPHDPSGLVTLFPNNSTFVSKLNSFIHDSMTIKEGGKWAGGTILANAWYWAGNEPNILSPWMFNFAGKKYQNYTVYWTRWLADNAYGVNGTVGLPGNDDFGTLSTWLTFSMLGFYPLAGTTTFIIGAPRFASVCISRSSINNRDTVGDLCVIGHNVSSGFTHVSKCELNGVVLDEPFFDWHDISSSTNTSKLEIWMSNKPEKWG
jgi:putative alpha-1,2-mannosidase